MQRPDDLLRTFEGHSDAVTSVAFSPDGARLLSGSSDNTLKLWDAASGQLIRSWAAQRLSVTAVAFSPDGRYLLSAGSDPSGRMDNSVKLWDAQSGQLVRVFGAYATYTPEGTKWHGSVQDGHTDSVTSVAFSPDGTRLVSGSDDKTVKHWDVSSGKLIRTLEGHSASVKSVTFSPDGSRVLSGGNLDGDLRLWDAATGRLIHLFKEALRDKLRGVLARRHAPALGRPARRLALGCRKRPATAHPHGARASGRGCCVPVGRQTTGHRRGSDTQAVGCRKRPAAADLRGDFRFGPVCGVLARWHTLAVGRRRPHPQALGRRKRPAGPHLRGACPLAAVGGVLARRHAPVVRQR